MKYFSNNQGNFDSSYFVLILAYFLISKYDFWFKLTLFYSGYHNECWVGRYYHNLFAMSEIKKSEMIQQFLSEVRTEDLLNVGFMKPI